MKCLLVYRVAAIRRLIGGFIKALGTRGHRAGENLVQ
jgi:hypothetical protein